MFWKKESKEKSIGIDWTDLNDVKQLQDLIEESKHQTVMIYKHSTRCGISSMTMSRLERSWKPEMTEIKPYYLDLITHRDLSNEIANRFEVYHESPQVILLKNGKATYNASHMEIGAEQIHRNA